MFLTLKMSLQKIVDNIKTVSKKGIGRTLFVRFFVFAIVPMMVVGIVSINSGVSSIKETRFKGLTVVAKSKQERLIEYFKLMETNLRLQAELVNTVDFLSKLKEVYDKYPKSLKYFTSSFQWASIEDDYGHDLYRFLTAHNYIDILLLDETGNILYSVRRDDELGTNLFTGKYIDTKFSKAAKQAIKTGLPIYSDMEFYPPYKNRLSSFYIQTIVDEYGDKIGLLAIHLSNDPIKNIMNKATSYGKTGETYLIGKDLLLRSQLKENTQEDVLITKVNTLQVKKWLDKINLEGNIDSNNVIKNGLYINHKNISVLGAQIPLKITGVAMLVISEINEEEAYYSANKLIYLVSYIVFITLFFVLIFSITSARTITFPIIQISEWARELSIGNILERNIETPDNEIGVLNETFCKLVESFQCMTWIIESFSVGDMSTNIEKRSENDVLFIALQQLRDSMRSVVKQANEIAKGEYANISVVRGERDELGNAILNMTVKIQEATIENNKQNWIKTGQTGLSEVMRGDLDLDVLTNNVISFLCQHLTASIGLFYVMDNDKSLVLGGAYSCNIETIQKKRYLLGEGMIGQCANDHHSITFNEVPESYMKIESGLGEVIPEQILIVPLVYNENVYGVVELCFIKKSCGSELLFLEMVDESIAIVISTIFSRNKISETLFEVQEKSEELQAQQEELKASNEELEEQTQLLRQSEEELTIANDELERKSDNLNMQKKAVEEKNKEVELKVDELAAASKYKSEFLANMSHELRTPLNSLLILAKMLNDNRDENLNERQVEWARVIKNSGSELLDLINEILDLSKVESGKMELKIENIKIQDLIDSLTDKFEPLAKNRRIGFEVINKLNIKEFESDSQRVGQVLKNLLSNAIKFTEFGKVTFSLYRLDRKIKFKNKSLQNKNIFAISVTDTGIGIAQEKLDAIFNAFQQEDGSTSRKYGGTGLGLSISKELARLLKGEISVESVQNKGCTFTLYLPVEYDSHSEDVGCVEEVTENNIQVLSCDTNEIISKNILKNGINAPIKMNSSAEVYVPDDRDNLKDDKKIVLIIEDNKDFAILLLNLVRTQEYMGIVAGNGRSGIRMAEDFKPTAILLDLGLPDMSGEDVLAYFKGHVKTRHIPVHIISGMQKENKYLQQGAVGFLTKPVDMKSIDALFTKINDIVDSNIKTILLIEDDKDTQIAVNALLKNDYTRVITADSIKSSKCILTNEKVDCVLLDIGLPDSSGIDFIKELKVNYLDDCPLIIHTGKDLNNEELNELNKAASSIIVKCAESHDRLLDETMLFLHQVDSKLPKSQRTAINALHNSEEIFYEKQILIVDDDMRNLFALSGLLAEHGMHVTMAENGQDALDKLAENSNFDLILMDIMMPVMDGYEAMTKIRDIKSIKLIPIISLTAKAMPEDRKKCIDAGADDYLTKPIDIEKLLSLMRVWLHK